MARQGKTNDNDTTGPESSLALDDADIVSVKAPDQLNMTIPMTGAVMSPFVTQNNAEVTRAFPVAELDDEKTVKVRVPSDAELNANPPNALGLTATGIQPVNTVLRAALPFREGEPGAPLNFSPPGGTSSTPDFTGTLTLSLDQQVRAEIQRITPFNNSSETPPKPTNPAGPIYEPQYVPMPPPTDLPEAFRNHLAVPAPAGPPPRTIGESAVAGVFAIPTEARELIAEALARSPNLEYKPASSDPLVLLYLERPSIFRIVRKPVWQKIIDTMEDEPIDPEADDPALSSDPVEIQQEAQTYAILKQSHIVGIPTAEAALAVAMAKKGRFAPPLEVFEGELEPIFDDVEYLRALVATLTPLAKNDEKLEQSLQVSSQVLQAAGTTNVAPLARRQRLELKTAYQAGKRAAFFEEIETLVSRGILEQKKYRLQTILGREHLCAWLHIAGHEKPELVYLPSGAAPFLPLSRRFLARMIAEIHIPQDDDEMQSMVIRCLALSKVVKKRAPN